MGETRKSLPHRETAEQTHRYGDTTSRPDTKQKSWTRDDQGWRGDDRTGKASWDKRRASEPMEEQEKWQRRRRKPPETRIANVGSAEKKEKKQRKTKRQ